MTAKLGPCLICDFICVEKNKIRSSVSCAVTCNVQSLQEDNFCNAVLATRKIFKNLALIRTIMIQVVYKMGNFKALKKRANA